MRWLLVLLVAAMLAALVSHFGLRPFPELARFVLKPDRSTAAQVRALMGEPDSIHHDDDGSVRYEYPRGPAGNATWMVTIDRNERYQGMNNVLVDAVFQQLVAGQSMEEVLDRLGRAGRTHDFPARGEHVLSWKYRVDGSRSEYFNAHFDGNGRLKATSRTPDPETINFE